MRTTVKYEKDKTYTTEENVVLQCFELTEDYAFLCPVENGALDFTKVSVYSNKEGETPIETIMNFG